MPNLNDITSLMHSLTTQGRPQSRIVQVPSQEHIMAGPNPRAAHGAHPIHIHPARPLYRFAATGLGAAMWFFLFYRARYDGPALLGWKHPWDH